MARKNAQGALDLDLPDLPEGPVEQQIRAAADAARSAELLEPVDAGAVELAIALGRAVDLAAARRNAYAVAAAARELREVLAQLLMVPAARNGGSSESLEELLAGLATPDHQATP